MTCVQASKDSDQLYTHWVAKDPMFLHAGKTLIRLGGCPGWSESSLGAHRFVAFVVLWLIFVCHYWAVIVIYINVHTLYIPSKKKCLPGEGKKGWIVKLHVRSAFLLTVLFHMALFSFFPDFLKKNLLYSCAFASLNHYRHVIIYSAAGKNVCYFSLIYMYMYLLNNKKNKIGFVSPLPDWPIESGPHNFFSVIKNVFCFFYQNFLNLYFAVSRSFLFYFIIWQLSILKLQKFSWFWYIYLLELIFPLSEIKKNVSPTKQSFSFRYSCIWFGKEKQK